MIRRVSLVALLHLLFAGGTFAIPALAEEFSGPKVEDSEEYYELYRLLVDSVDQIERNYVEEVDRRELVEAAIEGMINRLDPYSDYISPEELDKFQSSVLSQFGGIGIQVSDKGEWIKVISPIVGSPAYRAGVLAGDEILAIDGESAEGIDIDEAVRRMKGKIGTEVDVTVRHERGGNETFTLKRELVKVRTVLGERRRADDSWDYMYDGDNKIGYIRISAFSRNTARELREALDTLKEQNARGLVLDLRFNPGGLLTSAIEISDLFISEGRIVSTEGRNTRRRVWDAHEKGTYDKIPMAVLVNRYSASASEILSACLQDHNRALVIGERTWGKGSVQNVIEMEEGRSALKLTTSSYQRPSGKNIHRFPDATEDDGWGVMPNDGYLLKLSSEELAKLMEDRRDRDVVGFGRTELPEHFKAEGAPPEPIEQKPLKKADFVDRQLRKAIDYLSTEIARAE